MLNTKIDKADLYIGKNAGKQILQSLDDAESSIKIISPYVSHDYIDLLLDIHNSGIEVSLITSTDVVKEYHSKEVYQKIITQNRHTNEDAKIKRIKGLRYSLLLGLCFFLVGLVGPYYGRSDFFWSLALLPIIFLVFQYFKNIKIYSYTYSTLFDFQAIVSPHSHGYGAGKYLPHAKVYLIDDKIAFLGSVNFTKSAFRFNYETCIRLTDCQGIKNLLKEYEYLRCNEKTNYLNIDLMGSTIYPEPKN